MRKEKGKSTLWLFSDPVNKLFLLIARKHSLATTPLFLLISRKHSLATTPLQTYLEFFPDNKNWHWGL